MTTPFITSVQADKKIQDAYIALENQIDFANAGSDLGLLKLTDTPPPTGKHRGDVQTAGTYTNFGGIVFTQPELDNNYGYIYVDEGVSTKVLSAKTTISVNGIVEEGNTQAVSGGEVFNFALDKNEFFSYRNINGYVNKNTGIFTNASTYYRITNFYRITNRAELEINSGYSGATNNVALAGFYDEKLNYLGYYNRDAVGIVTNVQIPTESIPANTVFVRFTTTAIPRNLSIKGAERYRVDMIELEHYINRIKIDIQDNTFLFNNSQLFSEVGYINKGTRKLDTSGGDYRSSLFLKLVDPNNLKVTGYSGVTNSVALVSFYDKNLNWLGFHNSPTHGSVNNYKVAPEVIPARTYYVRFTRFNSHTPSFSGVSNELNPIESLKLIEAVKNQIPTLTNVNPPRSSRPNPDKGGYLKFLNYLGNNQNIHPKVLYFDTGWNGFKYWMAYTPYPSGNTEHENPCIAASNDGMVWETPEGLINPLELRPTPTSYNSDTHLVYNDDTQKLECWWRSFDTSTSQDCIKRRVSTNSVDFEPTEIVFDYGSAGILSPAVIYENGKYKLWFCGGGKVLYKETIGSSINDWTANTTLPIDFAGNGLTAWHMDVIKTLKGYEFVVQAWVVGVGNNNTSDLYYVLYDGATYSEPKLIIERGDLPTDNDYMGIYRASILYHEYNSGIPKQGGYYFIYYSALGRNYANRNIFLTAGRSVDRLRGVNL